MSIKVRDNLSSIVTSIGKNNYTSPKKTQVGRVYGVVTTENTPTKEIFEKAGGFGAIGTIFYLDYDIAKTITGSIDASFLESCKVAKPVYPQFQCYPLLGELVYLVDLPSSVSQVSNLSSQKYYITSVNLYNNQQQNSQPANNDASLGLTFSQNSDIRPLLPFEGDNITSARQGAALRFSTTTKLYNDLNNWSSIGSEDSPITILTNGLAYQTGSQYYVENINNDLSSIYLTSTQNISLKTDKSGVLNNLTNPLNTSDYFGAQIIFNSDRITINSKVDDVMIFATKNIEINTKNIINLNADERVHLNANTIFLGPYNTTNTPQPVLLGNNTIDLLIQLNKTLTNLASSLSKTVSTKEGTPIISLKKAGTELFGDIKTLNKLLKDITSKKVFTV
jgi:hypothetical protein